MDTIKFWKRVRTQIRAHKVSQTQLAEHIGLNPRTFQGWIYHNRLPDIDSALLIAAALGVGVEYLVTGQDGKAMMIRAQQVEERKIAAARIKKMIRAMRQEIKRV